MTTQSKSPLGACAMERYPHISQRLCGIWASRELDLYLHHLITDTREGQRKGFPADALQELMFLVEFNRLIRAIDLARSKKIPLREAIGKIEAQDMGIGYGDEAANSRDQFVREGPDLSRQKSEVKREPASRKKAAQKVRPSNEGGGRFVQIMLLLALLFIIYLLVYRSPAT